MDLVSVRALVYPATMLGYDVDGTLAFNSVSSGVTAILRTLDVADGITTINEVCPILPGTEFEVTGTGPGEATIIVDYSYMLLNFSMEIVNVRIISRGATTASIDSIAYPVAGEIQMQISADLGEPHFFIFECVPQFFI